MPFSNEDKKVALIIARLSSVPGLTDEQLYRIIDDELCYMWFPIKAEQIERVSELKGIIFDKLRDLENKNDLFE